MAIMGMGRLSEPAMQFKRKFRWNLTITPNCTQGTSIPPDFVKVAQRPKLEIDETEINHLNAKMFIPGKGVWQPMDVTYFDVATPALSALWTWLLSTYDFRDTNAKMGSNFLNYGATAFLELYNGCGSPVENWTMSNAWPKSLDFGELDYASNEVCDVKLSMRYTTASYNPVGGCAAKPGDVCCTACS